MARNLKTLGLCLLAVFALSAMAASAAQAEGTEEFFHSHQTNTITTGHGGNSTFIIGSVAVTCEEVDFEGTETTIEHKSATKGTTYTTDRVTLAPFFYSTVEGKKDNTKCKLGASNMTVKMNGCHFLIFATTTETTGKGKMANLEIVCPEGKSIEAIAGLTIKIGNQLVKHAISFTNKGETTNSEDITVTPTAEGIKYTCASAFLCGLAGIPTSGENASFTGEPITIQTFEDKGGSTGAYEEGAQVGVWHGPTQ